MASVPRAINKKRGIAVLMAVFFMILLSLIGIALIGMVPVELRSSTRTKLDVQAHYAATSGIRHAKAWCSAVMTPSTDSASPNYLGDPGSSTYTNTYCNYPNEIVSMDGSVASVEYKPMQLQDVFSSGYIPKGTARWNDVYQMLNIPSSGDTLVDPATVVLVKKTPIVMGDWSTYVVIIPDSDSPGGINTLNASKNQVVRAFGGSGNSVTGSRCYEMIALSYYQGFPTLRAKSTQLETTFGRYAIFIDKDATGGGWALQATGGQTTTEGPVHTNGSFKFAVNPNVWTNTNGKVPFNGLMTFATYADAATGIDMAKNYDGALYSNGNIASGAGTGTDPNYRPFDDAGHEVSDRYSKLIAGGKSNLRLAQTTKLPPDSNKLANAAYGTNFGIGNYNQGAAYDAIAPTTTPGNHSAPDGIFVYPNSTGKVAGGVVIKGDQRNMFLEVVNATGKPIGVDTVNSTGSVALSATDLASLKDGTANGNPALRVQSEKSATSTSTQLSSGWSTSTSKSTATLTTGSNLISTTITNSSSTGKTTIYNSGVSTIYSTTTSTATTPKVSTSTKYSVSTSTITGRTPTTLTTGTSYTTVGAAGGNVQPVPLTTVSTITNFTPTSTSVSTGQTVLTTGSGTSTSVSSWSVGTTTTSGSTVQNAYTTLYTPTVTTKYLTTKSVSTSLASVMTTITNTVTDTYNPIDQIIEAKNSAVTLSPSMFTANGTGNYKRPAGAFGAGSDMDVSHLNITQMMVADGSGNLTPMGSSRVVNKGEVVVIKQSRTDPTQAVVFILPADAATDGSLLNGAVYAEGNLGRDKSGGIAGVNYGRKSIGTQIKDATGTTSTNLFDKQPGKNSTLMGISNNLFQFGTDPNETDKTKFKAENGIGLVSENVHVNARLDDFKAFASGNINPAWGTDKILNIHAIIMGGSGNGGGLTVQGFTDVNSLTQGNLGAASANQTPLVRFVGGLILQNYWARINGITNAGWNSMNIYNQQLALSPPPWFPNDGRLAPLSYMEERIWADQK